MEYIFKSLIGNSWYYRTIHSDWFYDQYLTIGKRRFQPKDKNLEHYIYIGINDRKGQKLFYGDICYYNTNEGKSKLNHKVKIVFDRGRFVLQVLDSEIFKKNSKIYLLLTPKLLTFLEHPKTT